jgi:hypothetical protein
MKLIPALIGGLLGLSIALPAQAIPEVRVTFHRGLNFRECPSLFYCLTVILITSTL